MTYEGALYWYTHNGATVEQERECESLVKEALEKQIPKKVTHEATLYRYCTCPTCKKIFTHLFFRCISDKLTFYFLKISYNCYN